MINMLKAIPPGPNPPKEVYCLVEIPKGCTNKYEYHKKLGVFFLDRVLYESVFYPSEYGVIPRTLTDDGDPLDMMVLSTFPTFPGCLIICRPIAALRLLDSGRKDDKIIAVPRDDPRFDHVDSPEHLTPHLKKEIRNFWENYAELQPGKKIEIVGWRKKRTAYQLINNAIKNFQKKPRKKR
jgi:inorganic pyrophosphatase